MSHALNHVKNGRPTGGQSGQTGGGSTGGSPGQTGGETGVPAGGSSTGNEPNVIASTSGDGWECPASVPCCSDRFSVEVEKDLEYGEALNAATGENEKLLLDLYRPADSAASEPLPVMIVVHGGGFKPESTKDLAEADAEMWAKRGFLAVAIEYRRYSGAGIRDEQLYTHPVEDLLAAVRWTVSQKDTRRLDPYNIAVSGCSAGAITVAHAVLYDIGEGASGNSGFPSNFTVGIGSSGGPSYAGGPNNIQISSSIKSADDIVPYMDVHALDDTIVEYDLASWMAQTLTDKGVSNQLISLEGGAHCPTLQIESGHNNAQVFDDMVAFALKHMNIAECMMPA